jgi:hypothetical protein
MVKSAVLSAVIFLAPFVSALAYESPLRQVCNSSSPGKDSELASALTVVNGASFNTPEKRKANKESFYRAIKGVIEATASGKHLIDCLENTDDSRFEAEPEFVLHDDAENKPTAGFEYRLNPDSGKYIRRVELLSTENPMAAISFIAHEMQHACEAPRLLTADLNRESDAVVEQLLLVDEMRAYKLQADFFLEIARQVPSLVCETTPVGSRLFPGREFTLQNLMAEVDETITAGTFSSFLIKSYLKIGLYTNASHFFSDKAERQPRQDLINRFEAAGFKLTAP